MVKWNDTDERCPYCNQITKKARGLNKQNLKYLLWHKPTAEDWLVMLFFLVLLIVVWAYLNDTQTCRDTINNFDELCLAYANQLIGITNNSDTLNWKNFSIPLIANASKLTEKEI